VVDVIGPRNDELLERGIVAFDVVEPGSIGGSENEGYAMPSCPFLDGLFVMRGKVVLDDVEAFSRRISSSEVLQECKVLSPCFASFVVSEQDIVFQIEGCMEVSHAMKSAVCRPALCGLSDKRPLVSRLRANLQRTEFVQTDHPSVGRSPFLDLSVQRDDSFFLD